jgi:hypothetical protein
MMRKMQESAKAHPGVRDYHFYAGPDTGDLVNWESYLLLQRQLWRWVSSWPGGVMLMADDTLAAGLACGGGWYRVFRTTDDVPVMPSGLRPGRMR